MIKDLLNNNKRLKETVAELTNARRQFEVEKSHIYIENEELREKVEILEGMVSMNAPNQQFVQLHHEKEELSRRVQQLE